MATGFKINVKGLIIKRAANTGEIVTQADIQRATGIAQATISRWHNGAVLERLDYGPVKKLMDYFGCEFCELVSVDAQDASDDA
jgi:transcriptional regulator with XRE-family HTH domain